MNIDISRIGIIVAIVSLLGTGVTVVGKWFAVSAAVEAHAAAIAEEHAANKEQDGELDLIHENLIGFRKDMEHQHRDIYMLRKELRMSDKGLPLPRLDDEGEE